MHPENRIPLDSENFKSIVSKLQKKVSLLGKDRTLGSPWKKATESNVRRKIKEAGKQLPLIYQDKYVRPFDRTLESILLRAGSKRFSGESDTKVKEQFNKTIEVLAGAIYCHECSKSCSEKVVKALRCFLAVVSNTHRSFLAPNVRYRDGFPSLPKDHYPPLAAFRNGEIAPYMLTSDAVEKLSGGTVGVVVLPAVYKDHPLLWTAIAHEVGGHEMLNAMPQLLVELQKGVRQLFNVRSVESGAKLDEEQLIGLLWQYWAEETVADVCGVLNIGPSYGISLAVYQAALNEAIAKRFGVQSDTLLRLWSGLSPQFVKALNGDVRMPELDRHPTDILKLHVIIGAIENLAWLLPGHRDEYVSYLKQLATICAGNQNKIHVCGTVQAGPDVWIPLNQSLPLSDLQDAARRVGAYIATVELNTFSGQSLQKLESWDETDEARAQHIAHSMLKGSTAELAGMGDDAQLLAGATLAFIAKPHSYKKLTSALMDALEVSYARDPYWGVSQFHSLVEYALPKRQVAEALDTTEEILGFITSSKNQYPASRVNGQLDSTAKVIFPQTRAQKNMSRGKPSPSIPVVKRNSRSGSPDAPANQR